MKRPSPSSAKPNPRLKPKPKPKAKLKLKTQTPLAVSAPPKPRAASRNCASSKRPASASSSAPKLPQAEAARAQCIAPAARTSRVAGTASRRSPAASAPAAAPKAATPRSQTKQAQLIHLLGSPSGASMAQMMALTGWQSHTVRGAISGALRKRLGLDVQGRIEEGVRIYRLHSRPRTVEAASS